MVKGIAIFIPFSIKQRFSEDKTIEWCKNQNRVRSLYDRVPNFQNQEILSTVFSLLVG